MAILTVDEIREHVETDLPDTALSRLVDNADQEIIDRLGALATQTEVVHGNGLYVLSLARKAASITSATEKMTLIMSWRPITSYSVTVIRWPGTRHRYPSWRGIITLVYVHRRREEDRPQSSCVHTAPCSSHDRRREPHQPDHGKGDHCSRDAQRIGGAASMISQPSWSCARNQGFGRRTLNVSWEATYLSDGVPCLSGAASSSEGGQPPDRRVEIGAVSGKRTCWPLTASRRLGPARLGCCCGSV